jgi:hypothetical protein
MSVAGTAEVLRNVQLLLATIQAAADPEALVSQRSSTVTADDGIYVARSGPVRLFYSIGRDESGEYVLLLDLATLGPAAHSTATRLPDSLNPLTNRTLNPRFNQTLNPRFNHTINPRFNHTINPRFNHTINPRFNHTINPRFNHTLNPRFNHSLNPRFNHTLNPRYNSAFAGPYLYDLSRERTGYLIRATDTVLLRFTLEGEFQGVSIRTSAGGFTLFNSDNEWVGYWVPHGKGGFLQFDSDGEWAGFLVEDVRPNSA